MRPRLSGVDIEPARMPTRRQTAVQVRDRVGCSDPAGGREEGFRGKCSRRFTALQRRRGPRTMGPRPAKSCWQIDRNRFGRRV